MDLDRSSPDLISELPHDIIEIILTELPIRDVVRTCILSRSWRYKWTSMTRILFDDDEVTTTSQNMARFIYRFLSMHVGPIHKFVLCASNFDPQIHRWLIPYVCQKDVKELTLHLGCSGYTASPLCIYSCKNLTRLELSDCALKLPPSFAGFSCLKHLVLSNSLNTPEGIERLVSSCPLLENFTLSDYYRYSELTIRAPNLKCLNVEGRPLDIFLENTPLLVDVTLAPSWRKSDFEDISSYNCLEKLLSGIPKLERLCGRFFLPYDFLSAGSRSAGLIKYEFSKHMGISLARVHINDPKDVLVALHMIFAIPNLKELHIGDIIFQEDTKGPFLDYYKYPFLANRTMNRLELVKIWGDVDKLAFVKLIEFLLDRSPSLITMIINTCHCGFVDEERRKLLSSLGRTSQKASILIVD